MADYKHLGVVFIAVAGIALAALGLLLGQLLALSRDRFHQQFGNLQDDLSSVLQRALYQRAFGRVLCLRGLGPPAPAGPSDPGWQAGGAVRGSALAAIKRVSSWCGLVNSCGESWASCRQRWPGYGAWSG